MNLNLSINIIRFTAKLTANFRFSLTISSYKETILKLFTIILMDENDVKLIFVYMGLLRLIDTEGKT